MPTAIKSHANNASPDRMEIDSQRERILLAGQPGSGKSYALLALADYIQLRDPKANIYLLDADRGIGRVQKAEWPHVSFTNQYLGRRWSDVETFLGEVGPKQTARDWVFIDMLGRFWDMAQSLEVSAVHGISPGEAMLEARKKMVEASKLNAPGTFAQPDWTVIKRFHNEEFIEEITLNWDAHVVATTSLNKLDTERDDSLIVEIFAQYGYKPEGEKYNVHRFDTVMFISTEGDKRFLTTIKDRGRKLIKRLPVKENLWESYTTALEASGSQFADSLQ